MIPLTFLYDEYIDRPKLSEQKNPKLPEQKTKVGRNNKGYCCFSGQSVSNEKLRRKKTVTESQ